MVISIVLYLANKSERTALHKFNETVYIKPQKECIKYNIVFRIPPPPPHTHTHAGAQKECNLDEKGE